MSQLNKNISFASHQNNRLNLSQKIGLALGFVGLFILILAFLNIEFPNKTVWLSVSIFSILIGVIIYANGTYLLRIPGISNNGVFHKSISNKGIAAWSIGLILTLFYIVLYWFPKYLGLGENGAKNMGIIGFFDPLSLLLNGKIASQWFVY